MNETLSRLDPIAFREGAPIAQFEIGSYQNFVYLILDWQQKKAAIVDPQEDLSVPLDQLNRHGFKLEKILLTHTHFDHVAGVPELVRTFPGIPVHVHLDDTHRLSHREFEPAKLIHPKDGEKFSVGSITVEALHTPGHSAGELSYFLTAGGTPYVFTGDTIFIRDCGRTDLPTGNNSQMFASLQRIKSLPKRTVILPGHHYKQECWSTVEIESRESPPFLCKSVEELAALP